MRDDIARRPWPLGAAAVAGCAMLLACSSNHDSGGSFGNTPSDDASPGSDDGGAATPFGEGGNLQLGDTGSTSSGMGTGVCKNGTYSGSFSCNFVFNPDAGGDAGAAVAADAGGLMITGTITFHLSQMTGNGESFMSTASGTFNGTAATFFAIMADVGGTLDCGTGKFTGSLSNGTYSGFLVLNGTFMGPLTSDYNGTTFSFVNGTWLLTVPGQGSCPGTWSANYTGP